MAVSLSDQPTEQDAEAPTWLRVLNSTLTGIVAFLLCFAVLLVASYFLGVRDVRGWRAAIVIAVLVVLSGAATYGIVLGEVRWMREKSVAAHVCYLAGACALLWLLRPRTMTWFDLG